MKNMKLAFAKKYTDNFLNIVSASTDANTFKVAKKKTMKYEDVGYIKELLSDEIRNKFQENYLKQKDENKERYQNLIKELKQFYETYFANKEIIDVPSIKKDLLNLDQKLVTCTRYEYLHDINLLFEFKNNINVELEVYTSKHKSDEYMDMSAFSISISGMIKEVTDVLELLIKDNEMKEDEYSIEYMIIVKTLNIA